MYGEGGMVGILNSSLSVHLLAVSVLENVIFNFELNGVGIKQTVLLIFKSDGRREG